ncbi:hypothetical protein FQN50_004006 [Emmonsiellopsis sp. PD_5]|nr:hypothetical protein FQN50_004006 [Emmonsiellopsis sp. PD_5]
MSDNQGRKSSDYSDSYRPKYSSSNRPSSNQPHPQQSANEQPPSYANQAIPNQQHLGAQQVGNHTLSNPPTGRWLSGDTNREFQPGTYATSGGYIPGDHQQSFSGTYPSSTGYNTSGNAYGNAHGNAYGDIHGDTPSYSSKDPNVARGLDRQGGNIYRHRSAKTGEESGMGTLSNGTKYERPPPFRPKKTHPCSHEADLIGVPGGEESE